MTFSKTLQFKSNDLGRDVRLLLCFAPPSASESNPVAWKVTTLGATGNSSFTATYENNLVFFIPQVDDGVSIRAGLHTLIEPGKETVLSVKPGTNPPVFEFSAPTTVDGTTVSAKNMTGETVDIGFGFLTNFGHPNETLNKVQVFKRVGDASTVKVNFQPILSLYVDTEYQKNAVLDKLPQPIWTQDLKALMSYSTWIISQADDGRIVVTNAAD